MRIEVLACLTPLYESSGSVSSTSAIQACGPAVGHRDRESTANKKVLKNLYDQMPNPKVVVAVGACGLSGGVFRDSYNVVGGVDKVIPVDVYVPDARQAGGIIDGVVTGLGLLAKRQQEAPRQPPERTPGPFCNGKTIVEEKTIPSLRKRWSASDQDQGGRLPADYHDPASIWTRKASRSFITSTRTSRDRHLRMKVAKGRRCPASARSTLRRS